MRLGLGAGGVCLFSSPSHPGWEKGFGEGILVFSDLLLVRPWWRPCRPCAMQEVMKQLLTLSLLPGED